MKSARLLMLPCLILILALTAHAQTTGTPGFNDYTISGSTSGSTSCTYLALTPGLHTFDVSTFPGATVYYFANIVPCAYTGIMGCQGSFIDLSLSPLPFNFYFTTTLSGLVSLPAILPAGLFFSTQCLIFIPGCLPLMTQAYDVQT